MFANVALTIWAVFLFSIGIVPCCFMLFALAKTPVLPALAKSIVLILLLAFLLTLVEAGAFIITDIWTDKPEATEVKENCK